MKNATDFGALKNMGYVKVLCDDLEKMKCFYNDIFDFHIEDEEPGLRVGCRVGTLFLGLRPRGRAYDGQSAPTNSASIQLSFRVSPADVDIAYESLSSKGIKVIERPTNQD